VYQGAYKVSRGLLDEFGPMRVVDTPITELGFAGVGVGAAMVGLRPVIEFMTWNFALLAIDQLVNSAAKMRYMSGGQVGVPAVFRGPGGAALQLGAQHSQAFESYYAHIPGLKVVMPATPADAKGLLKSAIRDDNPVVFIEGEMLYNLKGEVPDGEHVVPLGQANVVRQGSDVTIVALALMVPRALKAADILKEQHGIDATVIDLRSLVPLDTQTILREVAKTGRLVTVEENPRLCGWGAEISSIVAEELFWDLDGPIVRITTPHVPLAAANNLEDEQIPNADRIVAGVRQLVD
jgi:pyruvate dehydrogenase E1 component beta subunit